MFGNSLAKIHNPILRSITAASASLAIVTLVSATAIGLAKPDDKNANKIGVYTSLLATVVGGVLGSIVKEKSSSTATLKSKIRENNNQQDNQQNTWQDWRNFVVSRKVKESNAITSFYLQPQDGKELSNFKPGQFLTIKLDVPEQPRPVIRTYSLSDYPRSLDYYRLSIKREDAPQDLDVPPGVSSTFMHDKVEEGSVILAKPPNGKFFLDVNSSLPAVLISNGVGITPMISMAKACSYLNPERHIWFLHGARNGSYHACREEVQAIAQDYPNLHIYYKYSRPLPEDEGKYHSQGYVDKQLLETSIIPEIVQIYGLFDADRAEYFLCGSPAFMDSIQSALTELDISADNVYFESFSGGKTKGKAATSTADSTAVDSAEIVFSQSGKTLTWTKDDGTILEFAEANDINPPYSCRQGVCLTCMCHLQTGEVKYVESPTNNPDPGSILPCISQPKTAKVVVDL